MFKNIKNMFKNRFFSLDDGALKKGAAWPSPRFTVDKTGDCVTDNLTGLMWTKNANLRGRTWQQALDYANKLTLCGYSDWRLPNVNELESMVNADQANTATWLNEQGFSNVQADDYWSSSTVARDTNLAWYVDMVFGDMVGGMKSGSGYVWPVRAGQGASADLPKTGQTESYAAGDDGALKKGAAWPSPRFTVDKTGDCVTDNLTGLMWTKNAYLPHVGKRWQAALDYANALTLCGYTDWRLPNRKELRSLINYEQANTVTWLNLPAQGFSNVQAGVYWSSSTYAGSPTYAWDVHMFDDGVYGSFKTNTRYMWPVRAGQ